MELLSLREGHHGGFSSPSGGNGCVEYIYIGWGMAYLEEMF